MALEYLIWLTFEWFEIRPVAEKLPLHIGPTVELGHWHVFSN
jgi:hypothetical protein